MGAGASAAADEPGDAVYTDAADDDAPTADESEIAADFEAEGMAGGLGGGSYEAVDADAKGGGGGDADDLFATEDAGEGESFMAVKPWLGAIVAPSSWSADAFEACRPAPESGLALEWVHGYRCRDAFDNVATTAAGDVVWPAAALAIVADASTGAQKVHVNGLHADDVRSLAASTDGARVATGGQGRSPEIAIWDAATGAALATLGGAAGDKHAKAGDFSDGKRAWLALAWSADDATLAAVGDDNEHTIVLFRVAAGAQPPALVAEARTGPERVLALGFDPRNGTLVSCGVKHIAFWPGAGAGALPAKPKKGSLGKLGERGTICCVAFAAGATWTGGPGGSIYVWRGNTLAKVVKKAHEHGGV